jgi:hypothetical protein
MVLTRKRLSISAITISLATAILALMGASPAHADTSTTTTWSDPTPLSVPFGSEWAITIASTINGTTTPIRSGEGTVDVFIEGIAGAYASALPVFDGGLSFFSQPSATVPLGAGTYRVTAIFTPVSGAYFGSSQTLEPLTLTITPLSLVPTMTVEADPAVTPVPTATLGFSGAYIDAFGGAPAGKWTVTARAATAEKSDFEESVTVASGESDAVVVPIDSELTTGTDYEVTAVFSPDEDVASGLEIVQPASVHFTTDPGSVGSWLVTPVSAPTWVIVLAAVILALFAATTVTVGVMLSRRRSATAPSDEESSLVAPSNPPATPEQ